LRLLFLINDYLILVLMISGIHHVSLEVRKLQDMIDFYSFLGFKVTKTAFLEERKTRLDMLCHQTGACLEFSSRLSTEAIDWSDADEPDGRVKSSDHIALGVDDLDIEVSNIKNRGISFEVPPKVGKFGRFAFLRDPEGNLLELIEDLR